MRDANRPSSDQIALYLTPEHDCAYLSENRAKTLFLDPYVRPDPALFQYLLGIGFRRSGDHIYRPNCPACRACVPVRVPVDEFRPRRSQRRCLRRNVADVEVALKPSKFDPDHYRLYLRYTAERHDEGGMADADEARYMEFLTARCCQTLFVEFRQRQQLMAVAVTDVLPNALSAVYTFFDPALSHFSPGVFSILWQIEEARRRGLKHLYLGYWIADSNKMRYKDQYRPLEAWNGRTWQRFEPGQAVAVD